VKQPFWHSFRMLIQAALGLALVGMLLSACSTSGSPNTSTNGSQASGVTPIPNNGRRAVGDQPVSLGKQLPKGTPLPENEIKILTFNLVYNNAALEQDILQLYTPGSATYHHFLTPNQIVQRYAESDAQLDVVKNWLEQNGYTVLAVDPLRSDISVKASVGAIEKSLGIQWQMFRVQGVDHPFIMQVGTPTLSGPVAGLVQTVLGLDTLALPKIKPPATLLKGKSSTRANCSGYGDNLNLTRDRLASVYQASTLYQKGFQGQGMTIGVAEFDEPYDPNDIANYAACAGVGTPNIQNVQVDGLVAAGSGEGEAALDLELIAGLAPRAQILDYQDGSNNGSISFAQQLVDVFNQVASDHRVQVLSVSYGTSDANFSQSEQGAVNDALRNLAAEGISVFISSGDCGAFSQRLQHVATVSFPASAPYAIAVGGTHLQVTTQSARASENVWSDNDGAPVCQNEWGSGGGVSQNTDFKRPSWQTGTGTDNQYDGASSFVFTASFPPTPVQAPNGLRQVPDVAAAAFPNISVYFQGAWISVGGTSAAAPIWAAGALLIDQGLQSHSKSLLGGTPTFYTLANHAGSFHPYTDITQGDNLFYPATTGWDYSTGWGAPNFDNILSLELTL
jgi:kumamolisin